MASIEALAAAERIAAIEDRDYAGYVSDVAKIIDEEFANVLGELDADKSWCRECISYVSEDEFDFSRGMCFECSDNRKGGA